MLRILSSKKRLCDGVTRRDMLHAGGLSLAGIGLSDLLRSKANASSDELKRTFGKAKSCILVFLYGSPSQIETFDVKPDAPEGIRGELGTIPSSIPGYRVGELLPHLSQVVDRTTIIRSMSHPYPLHGVAFAATGVPAIDVAMELNPKDSRHWPYVGSVIDYIEDQRAGGVPPKIPRNIALPFPFSTRRRGEVHRAGPYAAFLGAAYDPVWTDFQGDGATPVPKSLGKEVIDCPDPYVSLKPGYRFTLSEAGRLPDEMTLDRLNKRRSLVDQFNQARSDLDQRVSTRSYDRFQEMAFSLLTSDAVQRALDVHQESAATRELYGESLFGQSCLAARRLVEAGTRLATVFWDEYGLAGSGWDTHWEHYPRMKVELCPSFDRGMSGLILDLEQRGMLDETLVVCMSEHGRTPKLSTGRNGGRDHWSRAYSLLMAGGGTAAGKIVGKTDRIAGDVVENPVSPKDILATIYHLLGIDPETIFYDRLRRPLPIAGEGVVRPELFA